MQPKLTSLPYPVLWTSGLFSPTLRELRITNYPWTRPFAGCSACRATACAAGSTRTRGLTKNPPRGGQFRLVGEALSGKGGRGGGVGPPGPGGFAACGFQE